MSLIIQPPLDIAAIQRLSNRKNKEGYETILTWLEINEKGSFNELLQAMVECKVYAAADELLNYLESVDEKIPEDGKQSSIKINRARTSNQATTSDRATTSDQAMTSDQATTSVQDIPLDEEIPKDDDIKPRDFKRSISLSWVDKVKCFWQKRSKSCPADHPSLVDLQQDKPLPKEPEKNGIFIVSLNEDSQKAPMKRLLSFVQNLERVKEGEWHVDTIHDLPGGPMATTWLQEKVETAVYVLICFSERMKQVFLNSQPFAGQSECNLKFALDCLITGNLYFNKCYNRGGKFLPILLPGNNFSCTDFIRCLNLFRTYSWPDEQESIEKYLLNLPERTPPPVGERKLLESKEFR